MGIVLKPMLDKGISMNWIEIIEISEATKQPK